KTEEDPQSMVSEDGVALDRVSVPCRDPLGCTANEDPIAMIEGDDVAGSGRRAADGVVRRVDPHGDPVGLIAQGADPIDLRTDGVALHQVVRCAAIDDLDSVVAVAGDDVAAPRRCPADRIARSTGADQYAVEP